VHSLGHIAEPLKSENAGILPAARRTTRPDDGACGALGAHGYTAKPALRQRCAKRWPRPWQTSTRLRGCVIGPTGVIVHAAVASAALHRSAGPVEALARFGADQFHIGGACRL
jgi:hypothetical protein